MKTLLKWLISLLLVGVLSVIGVQKLIKFLYERRFQDDEFYEDYID